MKSIVYLGVLAFSLTACGQKVDSNETASTSNKAEMREWLLPEAEWKLRLSETEFYVLRQKGTERAFTGDLWNNKEKGIYICAACKLPLFESSTKFESGTGWPSFYQPIKKENVAEEVDNQYGMVRTEALCSRCGGHLGHVFPDGPKPTGLRYCINSVSMDFMKQ